jgi:hypothetical protein
VTDVTERGEKLLQWVGTAYADIAGLAVELLNEHGDTEASEIALHLRRELFAGANGDEKADAFSEVYGSLLMLIHELRLALGLPPDDPADRKLWHDSGGDVNDREEDLS